MEKKIARDVRFLKIYSAILTLGIISFFLMSYVEGDKKKHFEEIDVERINIVESNGDLKMVISNQEKQHPGMFNGEVLVERERPPGIIFFNEEQDEVGGLIYQGNKEEGALMVLSFDQYKNDQVMQLRYLESEKSRTYGLQLWDRDQSFTLPKLVNVMDSLKKLDYSRGEVRREMRKMNDGEPISAPRLFAGKKRDKSVGLFIQDQYGNDRIRIYVDEQNEPQIEFINEQGEEMPFDSLR
ncbi:hypothetical protein [Fodinibius salsisoli]|uniref:Outer membrane lipoprotein-sorting protein n=1 Tax=Fodinibius salsisoli TaxID=2820877 RepID=A0ABT3PSE3_9BACT|nr:hypothetical protein [Fodinibius salsisoli]MCW9708792.1 hypothetical protein [Fodinibius salsisoli]